MNKTTGYSLGALVLAATLLGLSTTASADPEATRFRYGADAPRHDREQSQWRSDHRFDDQDDIDERQARQRAAIRQGSERGLLTREETHLLLREQQAIERMQRRFESDGRLTPREEARLDREMDEARWNIRRQIQDDERRYYRHGSPAWGFAWR